LRTPLAALNNASSPRIDAMTTAKRRRDAIRARFFSVMNNFFFWTPATLVDNPLRALSRALHPDLLDRFIG
jgi:hypothetical protein